MSDGQNDQGCEVTPSDDHGVETVRSQLLWRRPGQSGDSLCSARGLHCCMTLNHVCSGCLLQTRRSVIATSMSRQVATTRASRHPPPGTCRPTPSMSTTATTRPLAGSSSRWASVTGSIVCGGRCCQLRLCIRLGRVSTVFQGRQALVLPPPHDGPLPPDDCRASLTWGTASSLQT